MTNDHSKKHSSADRVRHDEHRVPEAPPVREEYPGPQETSTGERIDPGETEPRPDSTEERSGRRRGAS